MAQRFSSPKTSLRSLRKASPGGSRRLPPHLSRPRHVMDIIMESPQAEVAAAEEDNSTSQQLPSFEWARDADVALLDDPTCELVLNPYIPQTESMPLGGLETSTSRLGRRTGEVLLDPEVEGAIVGWENKEEERRRLRNTLLGLTIGDNGGRQVEDVVAKFLRLSYDREAYTAALHEIERRVREEYPSFLKFFQSTDSDAPIFTFMGRKPFLIFLSKLLIFALTRPGDCFHEVDRLASGKAKMPYGHFFHLRQIIGLVLHNPPHPVPLPPLPLSSQTPERDDSDAHDGNARARAGRGSVGSAQSTPMSDRRDPIQRTVMMNEDNFYVSVSTASLFKGYEDRRTHAFSKAQTAIISSLLRRYTERWKIARTISESDTEIELEDEEEAGEGHKTQPMSKVAQKLLNISQSRKNAGASFNGTEISLSVVRDMDNSSSSRLPPFDQSTDNSGGSSALRRSISLPNWNDPVYHFRKLLLREVAARPLGQRKARQRNRSSRGTPDVGEIKSPLSQRSPLSEGEGEEEGDNDLSDVGDPTPGTSNSVISMEDFQMELKRLPRSTSKFSKASKVDRLHSQGSGGLQDAPHPQPHPLCIQGEDFSAFPPDTEDATTTTYSKVASGRAKASRMSTLSTRPSTSLENLMARRKSLKGAAMEGLTEGDECTWSGAANIHTTERCGSTHQKEGM
ncbi:unnamed protein product [Vitrella brassicaformis CCMP3155]|uniref:Uncharacterized protein n=1 Tax=Vitrella brassicaformis (strain CCMP3155) TaxID=1169540 RepID=A0A0G4G7T7_VITBC|nr:unnamed protein product [Vitrella brassicaformis CCMP3155]|eukprot:CEM24476.1 unnamed protein product [Vitrella brassicaformis CCMP3155]